MYSGWRNWGAPDGWLVRNPMYTYDDHDIIEGQGFWTLRRKVSSSDLRRVSSSDLPYRERHRSVTRRKVSIKPNPQPRIGGLSDLDNHVGKFAKEVTSAHGLAHIYGTRNIIIRLVWTVIVLAAAGTLIWQMTGLVRRFISFDTNTEVSIVTRAQLEFPAVTVCNTNSLRRSAIESTEHKPVLYIDDLTPLPYYIPCQDGDFACGNGILCVRSYLRCDGVNHCTDYSDEDDCTYGNCGSQQFKCNNGSDFGYCIGAALKCNGVKDCYDGEDEWDCECRDSEYKCTRRGGCIRRFLVCDGKTDCNDGSDETGCEFLTSTNCEEGGGYACEETRPPQCIPRKFLCDGYNDCPERDDEVKNSDACINLKPTVEPAECSTYQFDCGNGQCLEPQYRCDQFPDCSNSKDEIGCGNVRCDGDFKKCSNDWQCVHVSETCNFIDDCQGDNPNDEKNCSCDAVDGTNDNELFSINCEGRLSEVRTEYNEVEVLVKCHGGDPEFAAYVHYLEYACTGQVTCADTENLMPQTCTAVFTECYVNEKGEDYKGRVDRTSITSTNATCVNWNSDLPIAYGFTSNRYPLLGNHKFCRNPDSRSVGAEASPWCFIEETGEPIIVEGSPDTPPGRGVHWDFCTIPADMRKATCHAGITLSVRLVGDDAVKRVEVQRNGVWGTIQDSNWDITDGQVICEMLGQGSATNVQSSGLSADSGPVYISFVDCSGAERTLLDCVFKLSVSAATADHTADVGVECSGSTRRKREVETDSEKILHPGRKRREAEREHLHSLRRSKRQTPTEIEFEGQKLAEFVDMEREIFDCPDSDVYLPLWQVCNNYPDCPDGSDEIYCTNKLCPLGSRPCRLEDQCIETFRECDGFPDCQKWGLDEELCFNITACPNRYWKCPGRPICIPLYYRCDTVDDCGIIPGEEVPGDEFGCTDRTIRPPDDPFVDDNWYAPYQSIISDSAIFEDFARNYYRENSFNRVKGENPVDWKSFFTFSSHPDYQDLLNVLYLSRDEIQRHGHQQDDFILECTYDETPCSTANFTRFETDEYGNCYTFNFNPTGEDTYTTKTGPTYGLRMILNLQQNEYISLTGPEAGVRVTITPRDVRPLPAQNGITIRPGVVTSIGLRYENISRLGGLYGDCYAPDKTYKIIKEGEIQNSGPEAYDRQVCLQACLHDNIMTRCGCVDTILLKGRRCMISNATQDSCKQLMYFLHHSDRLGCDCHQECRTRTYSKTTSQSKWPSNVYMPHLLRYIHAIRPNATLDINDRLSIEDNLVRLQVFYEQLNYATTSESPDYSAYSLISDIGGTAGFYLGFSIITFIEVFILFYELCCRACCPWNVEDDTYKADEEDVFEQNTSSYGPKFTNKEYTNKAFVR